MYLKVYIKKIWLMLAQWFLREASFNFHMYMTFGQSKEITLTFNTHIPPLTQFVVRIYQLSGHRLQLCLKNTLFSLLFLL